MAETLLLDGRELEYRLATPYPGRPTLIFLHEGLGCLAMWRDFPEQLARATRCNYLVYSRLGYGRSDPAPLPRPVRYLEDEAITSLPQLISKLGIAEHLLIGHSDGGSIALIYAGQFAPDSLLGIVTEAAHVFNESLSIQSISETKQAYLKSDLRAKLARYHVHVDNAFWGWNDIWLHPDFVAWNIEQYLPGVCAPLLVMQGADDQYGTVRQVEAIANGVSGPVERCILADCRHTPHREQFAQTLTAMKAFIAPLVGQPDGQTDTLSDA